MPDRLTLREIDALVAEKVMRWRRKTHAEYLNQKPDPSDPDDEWLNQLDNNWYDVDGNQCGYVENSGSCREDFDEGWMPSEDMTDAWRVVEKMGQTVAHGARGYWQIDLVAGKSGGQYGCGVSFWHKDAGGCGESVYHANATTATLAICLAALAAHGIDVEVKEEGNG